MTTSIPVELISPNSDARRDQWGRYMVLPPGEEKPVGYTRVTTIAKQLDSGGALAPWKAAMVAQGMIMRRGLRSRWEALLAEFGDPWYATPESKAAAKQLVEDCAAVGGADDRREVGTALHAITSLVDLGRTPKHLTDETKRDIEAYTQGLADANIVMMPGQVELMTVLDKHRVAGTFDRIAHVPGFELPLIADLKTGSNLNYSWHSIAVQMSAYSRGDNLYRQGPAKDGSEDVRVEMPDINQDWGLILWLASDTPGEAELKFFLVDLNRGWEAFEHSMWARDWYKTDPHRGLTDPTPVEVDLTGDMAPALELSTATTKARKRKTNDCTDCGKRFKPTEEANGDLCPACLALHEPDDMQEFGESKIGQPADDIDLEVPGLDTTDPEPQIDDYQTNLEVRAWLQRRVDLIGEHPTGRGALITLWPGDLPFLSKSEEHTPAQLDKIEALCDLIERDHSVTFATPKPVVYLDTDFDHDERVAEVVDLFNRNTTSNQQPATT